MPVRSAATTGRCPGSTPNSPCTLGAVTSSHETASARPFGVTISRSIFPSAIARLLLVLLREVGGLRLHLVDVAAIEEGLLGVLAVVVELAGDDLLERGDRLLERHVLAREPRELRRDEERLREEVADLARARDRELVVLAELVHAEDRD